MEDTRTIKGSSAIAADLRRRIQDGEWLPDVIIPGEEALARQYHCSRMTMNKAVMALVRDGLLERRRKAGTRVIPQTSWPATITIPRLRPRIEAAGQVYDYRLLDRREVPAEGELAGLLHLEEYAPLLYLRCLHQANNRTIMCEDHWINPAVMPDCLEESFYHQAPGDWIANRHPFCDTAHRLESRAADQVLSRQMSLTTGAALMVVERQCRILNSFPSFCREYYPSGKIQLSTSWL